MNGYVNKAILAHMGLQEWLDAQADDPLSKDDD